MLQQQGYTGSERTLTRYIGQLREAQGLPAQRGHSPQFPPLTARRASYLIVKRQENREPEDTELLGQMVAQHPDLAIAVDLAERFLQLLRQQRADAFEAWLMQALQSSLKPFQTFAEGLFDDYAAVKASMMSNVSNGPVEGLNNRLKMLKRQMIRSSRIRIAQQTFHPGSIVRSPTCQFFRWSSCFTKSSEEPKLIVTQYLCHPIKEFLHKILLFQEVFCPQNLFATQPYSRLAGTVLVSDTHGSFPASRSAIAANGLVCQTFADVRGGVSAGAVSVLEAPTFSDIY